MNNTIWIDLKKDWLNIVKWYLQSNSYEINSLTDKEIGIFYYSIQYTKISQVPRQVYFSKKIDDIMARERVNIDAIESIKYAISNGEDLSAYQSKSIKRFSKDKLLYDWGIYHFHLGAKNTSEFVDRTGDLLYIFFDDSCAYFIDIKTHQNFTDKSLFDILLDNWPYLCTGYIVDREVVDYEELSANDLYRLRKENIMVLPEHNNKMIMPFGGGYTSTGNSWDAEQAYSDMIKKLEFKNEMILKQYRYAPMNISELDFSLYIDEMNKYYIYEPLADYQKQPTI